MAHQPTRFTAAQESKPSPSPGIRITGFSIRLGLAGHKRLFEFRPNRIEIRVEYEDGPSYRLPFHTTGNPDLRQDLAKILPGLTADLNAAR